MHSQVYGNTTAVTHTPCVCACAYNNTVEKIELTHGSVWMANTLPLFVAGTPLSCHHPPSPAKEDDKRREEEGNMNKLHLTQQIITLLKQVH